MTAKPLTEKRKRKVEDWLGDVDVGQTETHLNEALSKKKSVFDTKEGKVLFELQKSFKGDKRFQLDQRFQDDINYDRLPNMVKLSAQNYFEDLDDLMVFNKKLEKPAEDGINGEQEEQEILKKEKENQLSILREMFPDEKIPTKIKEREAKETKKRQDPVIQRFDPTSKKSTALVQQAKPKVENQPKGKKNELKKEPKIEKGVDKVYLKKMKAEAKLKEAQARVNVSKKVEESASALPVVKKKEIDYDKWKSLLVKEDSSGGFKLFG
eukprot:TRINITY_DN22082_c0_g1_i1.p1 TRINITY_DN22082_c0_g1~~TRINITY_DN22082_c0_g1_i1.p1  ORF type:complete len:267 (-),score=109.34 TRINITY_DN22082_c0_g1_i1:88-888(-)